MALIHETTNLKSLRFGKDRIGGGSSNQPYVKSEIPDGKSNVWDKGGPDFLLRGGLLTPGRILKDESRLAQMFFDFKSPNGLLFTAKQNILSRSAVATNGDGKALNEGAYLPTSTLLQAASTPFGIHLNKQGLDPTKRTGPDAGSNGLFDLLGITDPLGLPIYTELVKKDSTSRLEKYLNTRYITAGGGTELYSYNGGPGSVLGVGRTSIPIYKDRTNTSPNYKQKFLTIGENTKQDLEDKESTIISYNPSKYNNLRPKYSTEHQNRVDSLKYKWGVTGKYFSLVNDPSQDWVIDLGLNNQGESIYPNNVYNPGTLDNNNLIDRGNTLTQQQIIEYSSSRSDGLDPTIREDFRKQTSNPVQTLSYLNKNIEQRVNLGNPGRKLSSANPKTSPLDKITTYPIYKSEVGGLTQSTELNDLVKFRIGVIDNNDPSLKTYIHFRAFIDSMGDSYSADWQSQKFMGRGENFYRYNGFDRSINLSWTVVAQSKAELIPMYQKLNYLASVCAPDYSDIGYMRGNLITLTVGGYLYEQVGIIGGITYDVPQESPWEIAIPYRSNLDTTSQGVSSDPTVKELPHMIKVTGFKFIPIHNFVPKIQQNKYEGPDGKLSKFGSERYVSLSNEVVKTENNERTITTQNNYDTNNYIRN